MSASEVRGLEKEVTVRPSKSPAMESGPESMSIDADLRDAREAQREWASTPIPERLHVIRRFRLALADGGAEVAARITRSLPYRPTEAQTLTAEVLPLAAAAKWLEDQAEAVLKDRPATELGGKRPLWLRKCESRVVRRPLGVVAVLGPGNYPFFLPGVQILQALTAGNSVVLKPGQHGRESAAVLNGLLESAGLPTGALTVMGEEAHHAKNLLEARPDKVILTGSSATGRAVLKACAGMLIPVSLELSGVDAVWVLPGANVVMAAKAVAWGLTLNSGATCIAPKRVLVHEKLHDQFIEELKLRLEECQRGDTASWYPGAVQKARGAIEASIRRGARLAAGRKPGEWDAGSDDDPNGTGGVIVLTDVTPASPVWTDDLFAPVCAVASFNSVNEAIALDAECPFRLGASIFGPVEDAEVLARRLDVGVVCINDLVVPTADPRLPFGGVGKSGFGVTRGVEGLLALTRPQVIANHRGKFRPHYEPEKPGDAKVFAAALRTLYGSKRLCGLRDMIKAARKR